MQEPTPSPHDHGTSAIYLVDLTPLSPTLTDRVDLLRTQRHVVLALLRHLLCSPSETVTHDTQGRPRLSLHTHLGLSISHCPSSIALALCPRETPIGIDIESQHHKAQALLPRYTTPAERAQMTQDQTTAAEVWSAKEAIYKYLGGHVAGLGQGILYQHRHADTLHLQATHTSGLHSQHTVHVSRHGQHTTLAYTIGQSASPTVPTRWIPLSALDLSP